MRAAGMTVEVHDDHFRQDAPDEEWLGAVGRKGWVVLTKDTRIRYRETERAALLNAGVRAFVLTSRGDLNGEELATAFLSARSAIARFLKEFPPPFIARVGRDGTLAMLVAS